MLMELQSGERMLKSRHVTNMITVTLQAAVCTVAVSRDTVMKSQSGERVLKSRHMTNMITVLSLYCISSRI